MICLSCFFAQASPAQSPSISLNESPGDHYCVGQKVRIPVTVTGSFQEGNLFSVKISYYARGENQVKALPASILNGYPRSALNLKSVPILTRQGTARIEQLDMTRFPGGIYIMNIETGGKKQSFRIVKE